MIPMRARGQTLVLVALTFLLLTVMVCITLSIGTAAARKADLQNAADAAAISNATATARTFNTASVLNRTMVSHYVAMSGVQAQMAYASTVHNYFNLAANMFRMYDVGDANPIDLNATIKSNTPIPGCSERTDEVHDASYEMWHAALSAYNPKPGSPIGADNVWGQCVKGNCTFKRPWNPDNVILLEKEAAAEGEAIHDAIWDLARIEDRTYGGLAKSLNTDEFAKAITDAAGIPNEQTYGKNLALRETDDATAQSIGKRPLSFQRPFAEAVLGTRRRREPLELPTVPENLPPLVKELKLQTDAAFAAYKGQPFTVGFSACEVSADFSLEGTLGRMLEDPLNAPAPVSLHPTMDYAFGRAVTGGVTTTYRDFCTKVAATITSGNKAGTPNPTNGVLMIAPPMEVIIRSDEKVGRHSDYDVGYKDGMHWGLWTAPAPFGGCHKFHEHYHWTDVDDVHRLDGRVIPDEVLAFVLPDRNPTPDLKGAQGLWGQPVLPVAVSQKYRPGDDPFNLTFGFRLTASGTKFDMKKAVDRVIAPAAGIAYYHRRGHLGEPPNMLNPFWHATLVPLEVDERTDGTDPTELSQGGPSRMVMLLNGTTGYTEKTDALKAYAGLKDHITGLTKTPRVTDK